MKIKRKTPQRTTDETKLLIANCLMIVIGMLLIMTLMQIQALSLEVQVTLSILIIVGTGTVTYVMQHKKSTEDSDKDFLEFLATVLSDDYNELPVVSSVKADDTTASKMQCTISYNGLDRKKHSVAFPCHSVRHIQYDLAVKDYILTELSPGQWSFVAPYVNNPDANFKIIRFGERREDDHTIHLEKGQIVQVKDCEPQ